MRTRSIIFLFIAAFLVFGLFKLLKPTSNSSILPPAEVVTKIYNINVVNGKIVSGSNTLEANEGDNVVMNFTLDKNEEVHLHGYNKMVELEKGVSGKLSFTAYITGRFTFELENEGIELGSLEVMPKI